MVQPLVCYIKSGFVPCHRHTSILTQVRESHAKPHRVSKRNVITNRNDCLARENRGTQSLASKRFGGVAGKRTLSPKHTAGSSRTALGLQRS